MIPLCLGYNGCLMLDSFDNLLTAKPFDDGINWGAHPGSDQWLLFD
jgi:hypothetical protein